MNAVESIINVADLEAAFRTVVAEGGLQPVMDEIVLQSKVEFNHTDEEDGDVIRNPG